MYPGAKFLPHRPSTPIKPQLNNTPIRYPLTMPTTQLISTMARMSQTNRLIIQKLDSIMHSILQFPPLKEAMLTVISIRRQLDI